MQVSFVWYVKWTIAMRALGLRVEETDEQRGTADRGWPSILVSACCAYKATPCWLFCTRHLMSLHWCHSPQSQDMFRVRAVYVSRRILDVVRRSVSGVHFGSRVNCMPPVRTKIGSIRRFQHQ